MSIDREALIAAATAVMVREGGRLAEWHSWRCQYPEVYGQCNCNEGAAAEIIRELLPLIADAIKDVDDRTWTSRTVKRSVDWHRGMQRGARLVRSLGGNDGSAT